MSELWLTLLPLIVISTIDPIHLIAVVLILRGRGPVPALGWVAGATLVRLLQALVFGVLLASAEQATEVAEAPRIVEATLLLALSVLLLVNAVRSILKQPDEDAPTPGWMTMLTGASAGRASVLGMVFTVANPKLWLFTLGAIGAILEADLTAPAAASTFLIFAVLAVSVLLVLIIGRAVAPVPANRVLGAIDAWLQGNLRGIKIVVGLVFGAWFLLNSLTKFGLL